MKTFLKLILAFQIILIISCKNDTKEIDNLLWYQEPAKDWNNALPIGNGREPWFLEILGTNGSN